MTTEKRLIEKQREFITYLLKYLIGTSKRIKKFKSEISALEKQLEQEEKDPVKYVFDKQFKNIKPSIIKTTDYMDKEEKKQLYYLTCKECGTPYWSDNGFPNKSLCKNCDDKYDKSDKVGLSKSRDEYRNEVDKEEKKPLTAEEVLNDMSAFDNLQFFGRSFVIDAMQEYRSQGIDWDRIDQDFGNWYCAKLDNKENISVSAIVNWFKQNLK